MQSITLLNTTSGNLNVTGQPQKGAGYSNTIGNNHTVSISLNNFTGRIYIEGSLSVDPTDSDWFAIPLDSGLPYLQFPKNIIKPVGPLNAYGAATGDTGSFAYNFTGNFIWVRARVDRTYLVPPPTDPDRVGAVTKILLNYGAVSPGTSYPATTVGNSGGVAGPQGPIGPTGAQGEPSTVTGPTGDMGIQGPTGVQGIPGEIGPTGPTGPGPLVQGATGAVQYTDGMGNIAGDETGLYYDFVNKRLSIGTNDTAIATLNVIGTLPAVFNTTNVNDKQIVVGTGIGGTTVSWNEILNLGTFGLVENNNLLSINVTGVGINGVTPVNSLDVSGAAVIGSGVEYAGSAFAPSNGLIVQGAVGIGTVTANDEKLIVNGSSAFLDKMAIGTSSTLDMLPDEKLFVSGDSVFSNKVAVGLNSTVDMISDEKLLVNGDAVFSTRIGVGTTGTADMIAGNSAVIYGNLTVAGDIFFKDGQVTINQNVTTLPYLTLTNEAFIFEKYIGELISFTKPNYGTDVDVIDYDMSITRGDSQGIYNPYLEPNWDDTSNDGPSPLGTLWNKDGWADLTSLDERRYYSFYDTFLRYGLNVLSAEAVMKDVNNDKYYKFDFTVWGNASQGAPVTYTRTQLDPVTGAEIGTPVTFVKAGYDDPTVVNDPIDTNVTLARGNNQGLYNIAREPSYNSQGDGQNSPQGTEWNSQGWGTLKDVVDRSYSTFLQTLNGAIDENVVGKELVMHDTINDKYYAIKFSQWTPGNGGGGFTYTRQMINTNQLFVKPDYEPEIDTFKVDDPVGTGIGITRGNEQGIYNPYRESGWNSNESPAGTLWNIDGWDNLTNIQTRNYQTFYAAFGSGGLGDKVIGAQCILYIPELNKYYAVQFKSWTQGSQGGGFSYVKYEIDLTKLNEGVTFADGTILKSAQGLGRVKSVASGDRRIEEAVGSKTVSVTQVITNAATQEQVYQDNNTATWQVIINWDQTLYDAYIANNNLLLEISPDNTTWYKARISGWNIGIYLQIEFLNGATIQFIQGDSIWVRTLTGGDPVVWWDKNELPSGGMDFRGAIIDYHAYTGDGTFIGTIHIVDDDGEENITHTEVSSGGTNSENDDLWFVLNEGTISYRRLDGNAKTLKIHWSAKVFYGNELYD